MVKVEIIKNDGGFRALQEEWDDLLKNSLSDCIFLTWDWQYLWWKHLREDRKLNIVTVRISGLLIAIAPMVLRPSRFGRLIPFRVLEFIGSGYVGSDYLNIIVRKEFESIAMDAVAEGIHKRNLAMELSRVDRSSFPIVNLARQLAYRHWLLDRTTTEFCPYIPLTGYSWDSYVSSLGNSHRQNLRRKIRKLHKQFSVRFEIARSEAERSEALEILINLHQKRWQTRGGSDAFNKRGLIAFHRDYSQKALSSGRLKLFTLWLDDKPVAALYGIEYNSVFHYYQAGFDPDFHKYSVGLVVLGLTIKYAIEQGLSEFDFLHGSENYKYLWAQSDRELMRLNLYPPHPIGHACHLLMYARKRLKRVLGLQIPEQSGA